MSATATVNYHVKRSAPQAFHFDVDGIEGNLVSPELVAARVQVRDLRDEGCSLDFHEHGIVFAEAKSRVATFGGSEDWREAYDQELKALLAEKIGAEEVLVFDHTVREDDPTAVRKPARNVHNDYSHAGALQRLIDIVGPERAAQFRAGAFGFVNVWRPIEQAIESSPLGFILPGSMRTEDWMTIELVYPDRLGQILGVAANEDHEWVYLSGMTPEEVAIFNIYDNGGRPHLAHSALDMESDTRAGAPRKSIESRTLVRYA